MHEEDILIKTADGEMPTFVVRPEQGPVLPAILFYMDAPGIREELRAMARRFAAAGYIVLLPDLYYRLGTIRLRLVPRDDSLPDVWRAMMAHLSNVRVREDTAAMLHWLEADAGGAAPRVGCVGYCMSGRYVVDAACRFPDRVAAVGSLFGTGVVTDQADSPHLLLGQARAEMYFAFGGRDPVIPPATVQSVAGALATAGTHHEVEVFDEASHGFAFAERAAYDAAAAEATWSKLFALWQRTLSSPTERR
jgi:carboxymethylenebutenolidase